MVGLYSTARVRCKQRMSSWLTCRHSVADGACADHKWQIIESLKHATHSKVYMAKGVVCTCAYTCAGIHRHFQNLWIVWGAMWQAQQILMLAETQCCLTAGFGTRELKAAYRLCPQPALRRWCHQHFQILLLPNPVHTEQKSCCGDCSDSFRLFDLQPSQPRNCTSGR